MRSVDPGPVLGVDGCPAGWLTVALSEGRAERAQARIVPSAAALPMRAAAIAIDIPIGLMDAPSDGPRAADRAARAFLSARNRDGLRGVGSRVFGSPTRAHLALIRAGASYGEVRQRFPAGEGISKQSYNICGKIIEVDDLCQTSRADCIREAHPEVTFACLRGRTLAPKKSDEGAAARRELLASYGFDLPALAMQLPQKRTLWAMDDLLDACVLTLTAQRVLRGENGTLPDPAERDSAGVRRAIHY